MSAQYLADFSLALINRTGAYYVCRDVVAHLGEFFPEVRYWRLQLKREPPPLQRKLLGRAMLMELTHLDMTKRLLPQRRPRTPGQPTLFFDPLYVLQSSLTAQDVVLCHDVGPVTNPDLFDTGTTQLYHEAYGLIAASKPGMVFVSEASRQQFAARYGEDFRFMEVVPLYVRRAASAGQAEAPDGIKGPFLLSIGALERRKNYRRTMEAFARSRLHERGYSYVICGPRGNDSEAVQQLATKTPGVTVAGYLTDANLRWLYSNADGFVLPSLLEGFGLPALEAGQYGLVPMVSAASAQTEAVGEGAIAVDPTSVPDIAQGMIRLTIMSPSERRRRVDLLAERVRELSFDRYLENWSRVLSDPHNGRTRLQADALAVSP